MRPDISPNDDPWYYAYAVLGALAVVGMGIVAVWLLKVVVGWLI